MDQWASAERRAAATGHDQGTSPWDSTHPDYWVNYLGWQFENLRTTTGGPAIAGDPAAIIGTTMGNDGIADVQVYARSPSRAMLHYYWLNYQGWRAENLSTMVGTNYPSTDPVRATRSPWRGNGGVDSLHVFTKGGGLTPYVFDWLNYSGWTGGRTP